jgi:hypothetical protein
MPNTGKDAEVFEHSSIARKINFVDIMENSWKSLLKLKRLCIV